MNNITDSRLTELESQLALIQRHIEQQDGEMLAMSRQLAKQGADLERLRERLKALQESENLPPERPPHY